MALNEQKQTARKKGIMALAALGGTAVLWTFTDSSFIGFLGLGATAWLGVDWFRYRARWGLRF
jgi:hypothetical protein